MTLQAEDRDEVNIPAQQRFYGVEIGYIRDIDDPEKRCRIRVYCPAVGGDSDTADHWLPWAEASFPLGGGVHHGSVLVPMGPKDFKDDFSKNNIRVHVMFVQGDPRYPIYLGGSYVKSEKVSSLVPRAADASLGTTKAVLPPVGSTVVRTQEPDDDFKELRGKEPRPNSSARYPHNRLIQFPSGNSMEMDETPGNERIKSFHKGGTYWEQSASGLVTKVQGKNTLIVTGSDLRNIVGPATHVFNASRKLQVDGSNLELILGNQASYYRNDYKVSVFGKAEMTVNGFYLVEAGDYTLSSGNNVTLSAAGSVALAGREARLLGAELTEIAGITTRVISVQGVELCGTIPKAPPGTGNILMGAEFGKVWTAAQAVFDAVTKSPAAVAELALVPNVIAGLLAFMTTLNVQLNTPAPAGLLSNHRVSAL